MILRFHSILISIVMVCMISAPAHGDGSSPITLGIGGSVGIHKEGGVDFPIETSFVNQSNVRLKMLWILGFEYSYDLMRDIRLLQPIEGELNYRSKMRASVLFYPYSGKQISFYLGGGIGGGKFVDLIKVDAPSNSYHFGLGFEFHATKHLSFDTAFMLLVPGTHSIIDNTVSKFDIAIKNQETIEMPKLGNFLSLRNHEFMIRVFIFL